MHDQHVRTRMLLGDDALARLARSRVAVFGIGGVGGYVVEGLARCGVGHLDLIDDDIVAVTNLNRQIVATHGTLGRPKVEVAAERVRSIDPGIVVRTYRCFYLPEKRDELPFGEWDLIVDAIDTVAAKVDIVVEAQRRGIPIVSAMGCGNRLDPSKLVVRDLFETRGDPLARVMRKALRKRGVASLQVVCSTEPPRKPLAAADEAPREGAGRRDIPGSAVFVPAAAGLLVASVACGELAGIADG